MKLLIGGTPTGTLKHISTRDYREKCGMLTSWRDRANPLHAVRMGASWAMDNFGFEKEKFDPVKFVDFLAKCAYIPGCMFVVVPDQWADADQTLALFDEWHDTIRRYGYPLALAIQNGQERRAIPWNAIDCIFVGGSTTFKYSDYVGELVIEAHARRKWAHMGRVNSDGRWRYCNHNGFDSTDGTGMVMDRRRVLEALDVLNSPERPTWDWRPHVNVS